MEVEPVMEGAGAVARAVPGILGVALRSGRIRIYSADSERLVAEWQRAVALPRSRWLGHDWATPDMEDVFKAYSQGYTEILEPAPP